MANFTILTTHFTQDNLRMVNIKEKEGFIFPTVITITDNGRVENLTVMARFNQQLALGMKALGIRARGTVKEEKLPLIAPFSKETFNLIKKSMADSILAVAKATLVC